MNTLANSPLLVNSLIVETSVKSRRSSRVSYPFVAMPESIEDQMDAALERCVRILLRFARRGVSDPSLRQLAHAMKRGIRQVQRYIQKLVELGKLIVTLRRMVGNRNATNVYCLIGLGEGVGVMDDTEKKGEILKTTTPAPTARGADIEPEKSTTALRWEIRQLRDALDSQRVRESYADRGKHWFELQQWRLHKAAERCRMALNMRIGASTVPSTPFDPAARDAFQARERERVENANKRAQVERAERERVAREARVAREESAEREWNSPEMQERIARLNRVLKTRG